MIMSVPAHTHGDAEASPPFRHPIPFGRLVRAEWSKATDTRAARWLLALVALAATGAVLVPAIAPETVDQTHATYLRLAAIALAIPLPVVAILLVAAEWSRGTVLSTFTQEPRRLRVLGAKLAVSAMLGAGGAICGGVATAAAVGLASASGRSLDADLSPGHLAGYALFVLLNVLAGVALAVLLHNSATAIATSFALPAAGALLGTASPLVSEWIDMSTTWNAVLENEWAGHLPNVACSIAFWVAIPLTAGVLRTVRGDVT